MEKTITIKQARVGAGLSQTKTAELLGIAINTYVKYEKHIVPFRIDKAMHFCEITKTSVEDIEW